jgi:hypothetical protein
MESIELPLFVDAEEGPDKFRNKSVLHECSLVCAAQLEWKSGEMKPCLIFQLFLQRPQLFIFLCNNLEQMLMLWWARELLREHCKLSLSGSA